MSSINIAYDFTSVADAIIEADKKKIGYEI